MALRLLIADDSPLYRLRLSQIFAASDRFQIVGLAANGSEAVRLIAEREPDVLVLDLEMPELDGFSVLRWAMSNKPLPVVVCSEQSERESVFRALEAGAVDFISKPELRHAIRSEDFARGLRERVEAASTARRAPHTLQAKLDAQDQMTVTAASHGVKLPRRTSETVAKLAREMSAATCSGIICIVGSTGAPAAITQIIGDLRTNDSSLAVPVVIALHMPKGFTNSFAERLSRAGVFAVREAHDGARVTNEHIYVAPGGFHTTINAHADGSLQFEIKTPDEHDAVAPSADKLLSSIAATCGARSLGVILTGMGNDGLNGARKLKEAGGRIFVQSKQSALIWGMPRAVQEAGVADAELDTHALTTAISTLCEAKSLC